MKAIARPDLTTEHWVAVSVEANCYCRFVAISAYFKYRIPTAVHVENFDRTLRNLQESVLIGLDANAFSTIWHSQDTDRRGHQIETMIQRNNLICKNQRSVYSTFNGARGKTNIDITLSSLDMEDRITNWKIVPDCISSDHNLIYFDLQSGTLDTYVTRNARFSEERANWQIFEATLSRLFVEKHDVFSGGTINERAKLLSDVINIAASTSITKKKANRKIKPPWWTDELTKLRSELRRISRNKRRHPECGTITENYRQARNRYTSCLRNEKKTTWRSFCSTNGAKPYGRLYRWLKKGPTKVQTALALRKESGEYTANLEEMVDYLLNALIPNEPEALSTHEVRHGNYRHRLVSDSEAKEALWRINPKKAPGLDGITARIARRAWPWMNDHFVNLANDSLRTGIFPKIWKEAEIVPIQKSPNGDPSLPKSFRPVSLLPVYGKALERLICTRLTEETEEVMNRNQYGFTRNKSTIGAISDLIDWHQSRRENHTLVVFLDITGAFNNLLWTKLHEDLDDLHVSQYIKAIIRSYLAERTATLILGGVAKKVRLTKGCPQGSILGPILWNITMDNLLKKQQPEYARIQAYADDIAVSIAGDTRTQLVRRTAEVLNTVKLWGDARELCFSASKSVAIVLKSSLHHGFTIPFGEERIATKASAKYLGVWLDQKLNFQTHIKEVKNKDLSLFSRLRSVLGQNWGMRRENAILLYKTVFLPKVLYGADIWAIRPIKHKEINILSTIQRPALIAISSAYRTSPTVGLQVIMGTLPLDLEAIWQATKSNSRSLSPNDRERVTSIKWEEIINIWQDRWDRATSALWTRKFMPDIRERIKKPLWINHFLVQFLTGHGNFKAKLHSMGLAETSQCLCGDPYESAEHVLFNCRIWDEARTPLIEAVQYAGFRWPCVPANFLETRVTYQALDKFARTVLTAAET